MLPQPLILVFQAAFSLYPGFNPATQPLFNEVFQAIAFYLRENPEVFAPPIWHRLIEIHDQYRDNLATTTD